MTTDILQSTLSPTQERGESKLSGGIIHDLITNASGDQFRIRIDYTLVGGVLVTDYDYEITGEHEIPSAYLWAIIEEIIEREEGHTLIFQ